MEKFAKLKYSEVETKQISKNETSFTIEPLERGFGNTLGNAVRRVILSSLSGVAPFAIKIEGVDHEFQTISGVSEDVIQLILNVKDIKFVYNRKVFKDGEVIKVVLPPTSDKVRASNLQLPVGVEIVDNDFQIAKTSKGKTLAFELFLIAGRGFISFEENKLRLKELVTKIESKISNGTLIAIDSDFSPVENVSYNAIELNSSSAIIEEKLTINIKTNGSINAKAAISQASNILIEHLKVMSNIDNLEKEQVFKEKEIVNKIASVKPIPIAQLDFSVRSYNCLRRSGLDTLESLSKLTIQQLENIKNLGKKSINEIIEKLAKNNVVLKDGD